MRFTVMFVTAVCVLFLIKLRWPKKKSIYSRVTHDDLLPAPGNWYHEARVFYVSLELIYTSHLNSNFIDWLFETKKS